MAFLLACARQHAGDVNLQFGIPPQSYRVGETMELP